MKTIASVLDAMVFGKWAAYYWSFIAIVSWADVVLIYNLHGIFSSEFATIGTLTGLMAVDMVAAKVTKQKSGFLKKFFQRVTT